MAGMEELSRRCRGPRGAKLTGLVWLTCCSHTKSFTLAKTASDLRHQTVPSPQPRGQVPRARSRHRSLFSLIVPYTELYFLYPDYGSSEYRILRAHLALIYAHYLHDRLISVSRRLRLL